MKGVLVASFLLLGTARAAGAVEPGLTASAQPPGLEGVGFDDRLGERVAADRVFDDEEGRELRLGELLGRRPIVLVLAYYECPMLCSLVLNGMVESLRGLSLDAGEDFEVVVVSVDPGEGPELAAAKLRNYLKLYGRSERGWHFLTGEEASIHHLADSVGFRYRYLPERDEYAHPAGLIVLAADGTVSRYLYGVEFPPRDLRLALLEAGRGAVGSPVEQALLFCFHYDATRGRYGPAVLRMLSLSGAATLVLLGGFILSSVLRERSRRS